MRADSRDPGSVSRGRSQAGRGPAAVLRFGPFELDAAEGVLRSEGEPVAIGGQPLALLELLAGRSGRLVSRDAIRRRLWGEAIHVEYDQGINAAVRQLRQALGDDAADPRYVATVPRRGYRFVAPVERVESCGDGAGTSRPEGGWRSRRAAALGGALAVSVALLLLGSGGGRAPGRAVGPAGGPPRLAVLPLRTADHDLAWLAEGVTAELVAALSRRGGRGLEVLGAASAARLGTGAGALDLAAAELGAEYAVTGRLESEGRRVRVAVQLLRTGDGSCEWAGSYDRNLGGALQLEREVAERIALALELELPAGSGSAAPETDAQAYEAYLRGRQLLAAPDGDAVAARGLLERSVRQDPGNAAAWVELAQAWRRSASPRVSRAPAGRALEHALALDDGSAAAHLLLGTLHLYGDLDPVAAEPELRRAVELSPASAEAHDMLASLDSCLGRDDEAVAEVERALALDPLSPLIRSDVAWYLYFARRWGDAEGAARWTLERDPGFHWAQEVLLLSLLAEDRAAEAGFTAEAWLDAAEAGDGSSSDLQAVRQEAAEALAADRPEAAVAAFWRWRTAEVAGSHRVPAASLADLAMLQGRERDALASLERAYEERRGWTLPFLRVHPLYDPLRGDPHFQALLHRIAAHAGTAVGVVAPPGDAG